ncbi:MAG TPA: GNAT family N-acetyltransferase [Pyrinomonadaceae bacterium]|nr:GNAT family N-acetyltransferase [Pyrinomonadaceae bacterium]
MPLKKVDSRILIRDVETISEIRQVQRLQLEVWQAEDLDIVPLTHFVAIREVGGILIGAFDGEELVGFVFGFLGRKKGDLLIHSQMVAVKPSYRNLNLGYRLKLAQRERALASGITRMTWAFDPLQSLNAYFNFAKLGVIADSYKADFYGEGTSSFLQRGGTDRLWIMWVLDSERVADRLQNELRPEALPAEASVLKPLLEISFGFPVPTNTEQAFSHPYLLIEIPQDISSVNKRSPELAMQWRRATRWAFSAALASGYLVVDFFRSQRNGEPVGVYLLTRSRTEKLTDTTREVGG